MITKQIFTSLNYIDIHWVTLFFINWRSLLNSVLNFSCRNKNFPAFLSPVLCTWNEKLWIESELSCHIICSNSKNIKCRTAENSSFKLLLRKGTNLSITLPISPVLLFLLLDLSSDCNLVICEIYSVIAALYLITLSKTSCKLWFYANATPYFNYSPVEDSYY